VLAMLSAGSHGSDCVKPPHSLPTQDGVGTPKFFEHSIARG
jgi:hypothetical protein